MLQCHFLELVLSKHSVVYESVRTTHFVFHSQLRAMVRYLLEYYASRSDGIRLCINHYADYRWSLKPWHDCGFKNRHQLDKESATRPRATDTKIGGS